jgi:hypothetical protein
MPSFQASENVAMPVPQRHMLKMAEAWSGFPITDNISVPEVDPL